MLNGMNEMIKRIEKDPNIKKYKEIVIIIKKNIEEFIQLNNERRSGFLEIETLKQYLMLILKQMFNYEYKPVCSKKYLSKDFGGIIEEGIHFYERYMMEDIQSNYYYELKANLNGEDTDESHGGSWKINKFIQMMFQIAFHYNECDQQYGLFQALEYIQIILSFNYVGFLEEFYTHPCLETMLFRYQQLVDEMKK